MIPRSVVHIEFNPLFSVWNNFAQQAARKMKLSSSIPKKKQAVKATATRTKKREPVVPLKKVAKTYPKDKYVELELRSNPTDANSTVYKQKFPIFGAGSPTPQEYLHWRHELSAAIEGLNLQASFKEQALLILRMTEAQAKTAFKTYQRNNMRTDAEYTEDNIKAALTEIAKNIFPSRAVQTQKRWLRRYLVKPTDMKVRQMMHRLEDINNDLRLYPGYNAGQRLATEEINDMIEVAVPEAWQEGMIMQDFDPIASTSLEVVEFCERFERLDDTAEVTSASNDSGGKPGGSGSKAKVSFASKKEGGGKKYCPIHNSTSHDLSECKSHLAFVKQERAKRKDTNNKFKATKQTEEIHAMVQEQVSKEVKSALQAYKANLKKKQNDQLCIDLLDDGDKKPSAKTEKDFVAEDDDFDIENFNFDEKDEDKEKE